MTAGESLLVDDRGGVRTLTLNRPARKNALDSGLWDALRNALDEAGQDPEVRVLVVTGAGGAFCSGADLSNPGRAHPLRKMRVLTDIALLLHELPVPTIAKIDGVAVGAGWNLALGCDFVVATPRSTFSQIFSRRGLSLDLGGSWLLPKLVGLQQAKRLALLAETIDAEHAHRLNLVTWVEPEDTIDAFVELALTFFTPEVLRDALGIQVGQFNALSAGIIMGLLVLPTIASVAEDAMSAVKKYKLCSS